METLTFHEPSVNVQIENKGTYEIVVNDAQELVIWIHAQIHAIVVVHVSSRDIKIKLHLDDYAFANVLYKFDDECVIEEQTYLQKGANLVLAYYHLHTRSAIHKLQYFLQGFESRIELITSSVTSGIHHYDIECIHEVGLSSSYMENYAIVNEGADYLMQANGIIKQGSKGSKSHQSTRVLTSSDKQNSKVTPLLFIDENDVEASHAASVGQINEDHLYYLQTRGLSKSEAIGLLTLSYVLPILKVVEGDDEIKQKLSLEIEEKVGLSC